jgi:serine/threonine-protein kinase
MASPTLLHPRADLIEIGDGRRVRLLEVLGQGASSTVHRALLESRSGVRRLVAVKVFGSVPSEDADQMFALAARTAIRAACIRHPNVVEVYEFGQWRNQPFFVTELVDGVSLQLLLERYTQKSLRLPLDLALFIGSEIGEALSGARTACDYRDRQVGILHLALGPRKVLLGWRGEVKVGDFETSMTAIAGSSIRNLRMVAHRTATMAPEVAHGHEGDSRSDVFSFGVVLRELFVGPRFGAVVKNSEAVRLAREGFVQPMSFQPHLPEALLHVMQRALQIDPADRYPNASAMAFDLRRIALAMGVGDGRLFLRRALDREFGNDASEVTAERSYSSSARAAERPVPVRPDDLIDLDALPTVAVQGDGMRAGRTLAERVGYGARAIREGDILDDE